VTKYNTQFRIKIRGDKMTASEYISEQLRAKLKPEDKVKQERVIPYLRDVLGYKLMDFEVPVKFGRMTKFADIVIFVIEKNRKIPYIVVECKAEGKTKADDWLQAESYAQRLGGPFFVVTDGTKTGWYWYKTGERQGESKQIKSEIIPHAEVQKEGKRLIKFEDLSSLSRIIQQCHDIIRNEEGRDPAESFDEMSKLLFAKMKDERDVKNDRKREREFRIRTDERGRIADTISSVADRVKQLFDDAKEDYPKIYSEVELTSAKKIVAINLKDNTISQIVGILEPYTLLETETDKHGIDLKGAMFEIFLKGTFRGPLGQFFTPREIIDFMVEMVDPKDSELVLDPCCGSGGFLISSMRKVWNDLREKYLKGQIDDLEKHKKSYVETKIFGMDINQRLAWVAKMNMVFHGDGHGGIAHSNALTVTTRNREIINKKFDVILTNPPFGSKITDMEILNDLRFESVSKTKLTEVLFLALCINLLKHYGRLGIVLPDGILQNSSLSPVRDFIKKETIIKAVISIPQETFMPFGSGAKASLVFLEKKNPVDPYQEQGPVFMAIVENVGYDATGRATGKSDFPQILEEYHKFNDENYHMKG
jgi:type I restriction enzyme M protein